MKRISALIIGLALSLTFMAMAKGTPEIKFDRTVYDYGTIKEANGPVTAKFTYTNTGTAPLSIITVNTPCNCSTSKFSPKPLAPGAKGEITVTFNPKGYAGEFTRNVTVRTNIKDGKQKKKVILKIKGVVIPSK